MPCTRAQVSYIEIIGNKSSFGLNRNPWEYTTSTLQLFTAGLLLRFQAVTLFQG